MRNKFYYLLGVALLLSCYTSTFTSCINGVDDEYLDQIYTGDDNKDDDEAEELPDISGDYCENGDYPLKMTFNGDELTGKKVTVMADDDLTSATLTLAGTEKDLSVLLGLLEGLNATFTTYSPVPGEKELLLKDVKLFRSGTDYLFQGEDIQPTRTITYIGKIQNEAMTIDIKHKLTRENNDLLGAWKMGNPKQITSMLLLPNNNRMDPRDSSPLFMDWGSPTKVYMGPVPTGIGNVNLTIERPMTGVFNLLMSYILNNTILPPYGIENSLPRLIKFVAAEETGGMYASYSYTGAEAPEYSQDMNHNIMRYYFDSENQLRIEANADYLFSLLGDLLGGITGGVTRAQPDNARILAKELVDKLRPALEQGIPCEYTIEGDNMTINIDGLYMLDLVRTICKLVNDEFVVDYIHGFIDGEPSIADYAPAIKNLLKNMENALGEDCQYIKLGLRMVRTTP